MIKCCIFDLDGTLLNTISTITHYVNRALGEHLIEGISEEECKVFVGTGARELIKKALASKNITDSETFDKVFPTYTELYNSAPLYLTEVYDGIPETLSFLRRQGIKLAVLSNKPDLPTRSVVEKFFPGVFDYVAGAKDGVALKPSAEGVMPIFDFFGVSPDECAWIGDTATDILTGKNAGVALKIGVLWGFRDRAELSEAGADLIVTEAKEILDGALRVE